MLKEVKRSEIPKSLGEFCEDTLREFLNTKMEAAVVSHKYYTQNDIFSRMSEILFFAEKSKITDYQKCKVNFCNNTVFLIRKDGE